jgi:hypothetical protein
VKYPNIEQKKLNYGNYFDTHIKINEIINEITKHNLKEYLTIITNEYKGRITDSEICEEAGNWIYNEFNKIPKLNTRKLHWSERSNIYNLFKYYSSYNIEAELPGSSNDSEIFILSAHYDCDYQAAQTIVKFLFYRLTMTVTKKIPQEL